MKKAIIIGCICFFIGVILLGTSVVMVGFNLSELVASNSLTQTTYIIEDKVERVVVDGLACDITIMPSSNKTCKIVSYDGKNLANSFVLNNGTLSIGQTDSRKWYEYITLNFGTSIKLYLPAGSYESLFVTTGSGDVTVSPLLAFDSVKIESKSGEVDFKASVSEDLTIKTSSGDIDATWKSTKFVDLISKSGKIEVDGFEGEEIRIETNSGDVDGQIFGDIIYETETKSGYISVPPSGMGGKCLIKTHSGDIDIE